MHCSNKSHMFPDKMNILDKSHVIKKKSVLVSLMPI